MTPPVGGYARLLATIHLPIEMEAFVAIIRALAKDHPSATLRNRDNLVEIWTSPPPENHPTPTRTASRSAKSMTACPVFSQPLITLVELHE